MLYRGLNGLPWVSSQLSYLWRLSDVRIDNASSYAAVGPSLSGPLQGLPVFSNLSRGLGEFFFGVYELWSSSTPGCLSSSVCFCAFWALALWWNIFFTISSCAWVLYSLVSMAFFPCSIWTSACPVMAPHGLSVFLSARLVTSGCSFFSLMCF